MLASHLHIETDLFAGTGNHPCPDDSIFKVPPLGVPEGTKPP